MLIVTRCPGESLSIDNDNIVVTLLDVQRRRVRIGILADRSIPINGRGPKDPEAANKPGRGFLVIPCRETEMIQIGEDIFVTVVEIKRGRAKIGVDADEAISVDRTEVYERKRLEEAANEPEDFTERIEQRYDPPTERPVPVRHRKRRAIDLEDRDACLRRVLLTRAGK